MHAKALWSATSSYKEYQCSYDTHTALNQSMYNTKVQSRFRKSTRSLQEAASLSNEIGNNLKSEGLVRNQIFRSRLVIRDFQVQDRYALLGQIRWRKSKSRVRSSRQTSKAQLLILNTSSTLRSCLKLSFFLKMVGLLTLFECK